MRQQQLPLISVLASAIWVVSSAAFAAGDPAATLKSFVERHVGQPRVITPVEGVHVAVGYDLANVAVVSTAAGIVVIDSGSCTPQALVQRSALAEHADGPVRALIYTHNDIEQTGGGGVWVEADTPIWGSRLLRDEFLRQFILLQENQVRRGIRQFGLFLPAGERQCSAWGRLPELEHIGGIPEIRLPTQLVDEEAHFEVGGVEFQIWSAPGATPDHVCIWVPSKKTLFVGDNFVNGFPDLSPLRGTPNLDPKRWIQSLDRMRAAGAEHLVSARHAPLSGEAAVQAALRDYRDAIQWVYSVTVRGINDGRSIDELAEKVDLPPHLKESPYLAQVTCTPEWACRGIYSQLVGWFDEQPELALPARGVEVREIELMGGASAVLAAAETACDEGDPSFALHLLAKLKVALTVSGDPQGLREKCDLARAEVLRKGAESSAHSDVRGFLSSLAAEALGPTPELARWPSPSEESLQQIPLETFFESMGSRLKPDRTLDVNESIGLNLSDSDRKFVITVRHGVLEVSDQELLPGSPVPAAWLTVTELDWKRLCLGVLNPTLEVMSGRLKISGERQALRNFIGYFELVRDFERLTSDERLAKRRSDPGN